VARQTSSDSDKPNGKRRSAASRSTGKLEDLYGSPDFLIRRAHQIATAAFADACADLCLTPSQYAAMFALRQQSSLGQNALGRLIALDRSTASLVVKSLKARGLVVATSDPADRRKDFLELTDRGRLLLAQAEKRTARASTALLSVFDPDQAELFLSMLKTLNEAAPPIEAAVKQ